MLERLSAIAVLLLPVARVLAVEGDPGNGGPNQTIEIPDPLGGEGFEAIVQKLIIFLTQISIPIVAIMIIIGGIYLMTAGGDEGKILKGKDIIKYAVIGFAVVLSANGVIFIIRDILQ